MRPLRGSCGKGPDRPARREGHRDLTSGTAVVEGDVTDEAIRAAVTDAGYTVKGIQ